MRSNASLAARKASARAVKLFGVARAACALLLLLTLAAPALLYGARGVGAQSPKSRARDESAQDAKEKDARKAKDKKDAQGEKGDSKDNGSEDADAAKDKDRMETPLLIRPAPLMRVRPATPAQSKSLPGAENAPAPSAQTQTSTRPAQTKTTPQQSGTAQAPRADTTQVSVFPSSPVSVTQVSFSQLSEKAAAAPLSSGPRHLMAIHAPLTIPDPPAPEATAAKRPKSISSSRPSTQEAPAPAPAVASPSPSQSFMAQEDLPKVSGPQAGFSFIPPDTQGAVGLDKVFVNTNSNYRVQNKLTGAALSTVAMDVFWNPSNTAAGGSGFFDPRITFDPYNQRWILAAVSDAETAQSSIEIAISDTSDPQGAYHVYRFIVGCAINTAGCVANGNPFFESDGEWADFPMLGFNKNWIAVSVNMFGNATDNFIEGRVLVIDYPQALTGSIPNGHAKLFGGPTIGFCLHPVETYDPNEGTLYLPQHVSTAGRQYDLSTITGTPSSPSLTIGSTMTRQGSDWQAPGGNILPQTCTGTCPSTLLKIDVGDSYLRGNAVFRNHHVYYTQTVGLPAAGDITHTAVQWTKLNTDGTFADGGRVEDPTATSTNGGKWYAYPTIAVNKTEDFLIGFSQFSSSQFASAGYAYHDHTDASGATRDPFIFKAGEDYYAKTFGAGRNRWGDYSHTVVDPVNDTDIWTIQEYARLRTPPDTSVDTNASNWGTWWAKLSLSNPGSAGQLVISEFRLRGPGGAQDEYVEIYNASGGDITVQTSDGSLGYGLFASDGTLRFMIPNGTLIPARGHYLGVNSNGYSLTNYPAGSSTTATGDATYTTDIADNAGIALFNTSDQTHILTATLFDAVGSTSELNTRFKEGNGYPAIVPTNLEYAFVRDLCGKGGSTSATGPCPTDGTPKDTNDNAADFVFVDTTGTNIGAGARVGAPGPENSHSPLQRNDTMSLSLLDPAAGSALSPNRFRDPTPNTPSATLGPFGTLSIRRTVTNNTGQAVTRLRFRIIDISTSPVPPGTADLRAVTSGAAPATVAINGTNPACPSNTCTVQQTTLETPPTQAGGGGFNSTLAVGAVGPGAAPATSEISVALGTPIPPGGSINVQLTLGVRQTGNFRIFVNVEAETAAP